MCECGSGPVLVCSDVFDDLQPTGDGIRRIVAVVDFREQRAVLELVDRDNQAIAMDEVRTVMSGVAGPNNVGGGGRLAGQTDALGDVFVVEYVVVGHCHLALEEADGAG